jgi:hypothetical protein
MTKQSDNVKQSIKQSINKTSKGQGDGAAVAGLIRKSDVRYPDGCDSPEAREAYERDLVQTRMAELVTDATRDGLTITRWYIDLDVSGRAAYEHRRAGLMQLLADARAGLVHTLYARELARIYRDTVKSIVFKGEMRRLGVDVRARDMMRSEDAAAETLVQTIQFAVDQFQAERTGQQIRSRNLELFLHDGWPGLARDMWGLRYDAQAHLFYFDPATAAYVAQVMERLVAERGNAYRVALAFNASLQAGDPEAISTPGGKGAMWAAKDVLRLAESPFYRRRGRYAGQTRDQPGLIPEVVPPSLTDAVDYVLSLRRQTLGGRRRRGGREDYTYGPLMRCADCSGRMRTMRFLAMRDAGDPRWLYWVCRQGSNSRVVCPHSWSFTQIRLDQLVGKGLQKALEDAREQSPMVDQVKAKGAGKSTEKMMTTRQKGDPETVLARIAAQIERTMRLYTSGVTQDFDWVQSEVARLEGQRSAVRDQEEQQQENAVPAALPRLSLAEWETLNAKFSECWQTQMTLAMEPRKSDFLLFLGVSLSVQTLPRTRPPAGRGEKRRAGGCTGGPLRITMEIERLRLVGENAVTVAETEEEWYAHLSERGRKARGSGNETAKE